MKIIVALIVLVVATLGLTSSLEPAPEIKSERTKLMGHHQVSMEPCSCGPVHHPRPVLVNGPDDVDPGTARRARTMEEYRLAQAATPKE